MINNLNKIKELLNNKNLIINIEDNETSFIIDIMDVNENNLLFAINLNNKLLSLIIYQISKDKIIKFNNNDFSKLTDLLKSLLKFYNLI